MDLAFTLDRNELIKLGGPVIRSFSEGFSRYDTVQSPDKTISLLSVPGMPDLGPKSVKISPKWDKSVSFSDQISLHFDSPI